MCAGLVSSLIRHDLMQPFPATLMRMADFDKG